MVGFLGKLANILIIATLVVGTASPAHAIRLYRCNGMIQQRPCSQSIEDITGRRVIQPSAVRRHLPAPIEAEQPRFSFDRSKLYARVISHSFQRLNSREGKWQGKIEGNGEVHLVLEWFEAEALMERNAMGSVTLKDSATSFGFRTALPRESNWTWRLSAYATIPGEA
ncbi:MAG: hypothetical protein K1X79_01805 [Oligoflexia bacterium]|nr:hypothetical protein [Oligoflexia bacterium]